MMNILKFLACALSFPTLVQAADHVSETDYFQELPVVLSASRLSQPLSEAPNAMTVIDRKMIAASGLRNIADLFKLVPGMYVSYYKGSQPFVSYHGSTDQYARRMQVMLDGRSVYLPPTSTVAWADLPITVDDIERIEAIRGPAAASHGANSTQGVISIVTRDAGGVAGREFSLTRGDKGVNDVAARFGSRGEQLDYRATLAYTADNGYDNLWSPPNGLPLTYPKAATLINNSNDSKLARLFNYRADFHPNAVDRYDIQLGANRDLQTVGWTDSLGDPVHDMVTNSGFVQLGWVRALEHEAELSLRYSHTEQNQQEAFTVVKPSGQSARVARDELELQHTLHLSAANRLVYGAGWQRDQLSGQGYAPALKLLYGVPASYASSSSVSESRLFAHDEWRLTPQFLLNAGAMLEDDGLGHRKTSPRLALNYHLLPGHTLRLGSSLAYRTPASGETHFRRLQPGAIFVPSPAVTSPNLQPERLLSREIGYLGEYGRGTLDLRFFSDQLSDGIYVTNATIFANGFTAAYQGLEATLKQAVGAEGELTVNFAHELANSNGPALAAAGVKSMRPASTWIGDILSGSTPRNSASLLYSQRLRHDYSLSLAYYRQDAMQPFDRGAIDYQPIQRRLDMKLARAFKQGGLKGELALVVQDLFDQRYTEYVANNTFNRRGYLALNLNW